MRAVADTNVLISGLLWRGPPHALLEQARGGTLSLISSVALLAEFEDVIRRPKFRTILRRTRTDARRVVRELHRLVETVGKLGTSPGYSGRETLNASLVEYDSNYDRPAVQLLQSA